MPEPRSEPTALDYDSRDETRLSVNITITFKLTAKIKCGCGANLKRDKNFTPTKQIS